MDSHLRYLQDIWGPDINSPISTTALAWIQSAPLRRAEETCYLDFKEKHDSSEPSLHDDDRANLAKAISGFANTDGGLIIWGVKAKPKSKEDPDVATACHPIRHLKKFRGNLEALAGSVVVPPVPGVHHRSVPLEQDDDVGYVITIVPKRRLAMTQASSKTCKGFYVRSGSGCYQLPEPLIAEFYRQKPTPSLHLTLKLAEPDQVHLLEEITEAEQWKIMASQRKPWGRCTFRQSLAIEWTALLKNVGLGSAHQLVFVLTVSGASVPWNVITFGVEKEYYTDAQSAHVPIYRPMPTQHFMLEEGRQATGKILESIHPGQEIKVAFGALHVPLDAFDGEIARFEVSGSAYSTDSPFFSIGGAMDGPELRSRYLPAFQRESRNALPAIRTIEEPPSRMFNFDES